MTEANIDTDQIIPARFLQKPRREGCGPWLFHDLRENPAFILNQPAYREARALVAAENFGCGSSRENAVWALYDFGFRVVIAPSFGDIFYNNCLQNGLLPIRLAQVHVDKLLAASPGETIAVDLESQTVAFGQEQWKFDINPFAKHWLLDGIDELGVLLYGHKKNAYWYGSQLSIDETREVAPYQNATGLQVTSAVLAGMVWALENPKAGIVETDEMDFRRCLEVQMPYLGPVIGTYTDWTPLTGRPGLFPEDIDKRDPWQFRNVLMH